MLVTDIQVITPAPNESQSATVETLRMTPRDGRLADPRHQPRQDWADEDQKTSFGDFMDMVAALVPDKPRR
jgi:hypothetical protein